MSRAEQELERGEVKFVVVEVKVRKIAVDGNEHFSAENIRRSVLRCAKE